MIVVFEVQMLRFIDSLGFTSSKETGIIVSLGLARLEKQSTILAPFCFFLSSGN